MIDLQYGITQFPHILENSGHSPKLCGIMPLYKSRLRISW